jgi:hypothetical protein
MRAHEEGQLIIALRNAIIAVQAGARQHTAPQALAALSECRRRAQQLFAEDLVALTSFQDCLAEIERHLRSGAFDDAFQVAERQRQQLQSLALMYAQSGDLPEYATELEQLARHMTTLDHYVGQLCQATYADRGSPSTTLMFGMLRILEYALAGDLGEGLSPSTLLEEKATQSEASAAEVSNCTRLVRLFLDEGIWAEVEATAKREGMPRLVTLTTWLVETAERVHPRPSGPLVRGHYVTLASFVFTVGLLVRQSCPQLSQDLVAEEQAYAAAQGAAADRPRD